MRTSARLLLMMVGGKDSDEWEIVQVEEDGQVTKIGKPLRDRLTMFYTKWDPSKLESLDESIAMYENDEAALNEMLLRTYGEDVALAPATPAPASAKEFKMASSDETASFVNFLINESPIACRASPAVPLSSIRVTSPEATEPDIAHIMTVTDTTDLHGARIVLMMGRNFESSVVRSADADSLKDELLAKLHSVSGPFTILYLHTDASSNSPGFSWLRRIHDGLAAERRNELMQVVVVHPSLTFKSAMWMTAPFNRNFFWEKLHYCDRVEFLTDFVSVSEIERLNLPAFVVEHDNELEQAPLMDYGIYPIPGVETPQDIIL